MSAPPAEASERPARAKAEAEAAAAEDPRAAGAPLWQQLESLYAAGASLAIALKRFFGALGRLLAAEGAVVRHGLPLLFLGTIALIALAVSLWACTVALIGWALAVATHSAGIALGILVFGHAALVAGLWIAIQRGMRQASFPHARAELRALRRQLARDFDEFAQHAPTRTDSPP